MFKWFSRWLKKRRARRNIGKQVRFLQFCQFGMSVHEGKITGVSDTGYLIKEGIYIRRAWFHDVEFIE